MVHSTHCHTRTILMAADARIPVHCTGYGQMYNKYCTDRPEVENSQRWALLAITRTTVLYIIIVFNFFLALT